MLEEPVSWSGRKSEEDFGLDGSRVALNKEAIPAVSSGSDRSERHLIKIVSVQEHKDSSLFRVEAVIGEARVLNSDSATLCERPYFTKFEGVEVEQLTDGFHSCPTVKRVTRWE